MSGLEIDFETRSNVDLKKHGVYRYMASPHTKPLMASYKINGGPVKRWLPREPCPQDIVDHVEAGGMVSAHNNAFERLLWQMILTPRYGWPVLRLEQCRCTAATAAAMSLPRDLAGLGAALNLDVQKDKEGKALIRFFCIPRKPRKDEDPDGLYFNEPEEFPEKFARFHDYCDDDVETEAHADRRMVPLSDYEQDLWLIDQRINDRGIRIDRTSALAAINLAEKAKALLDREMRAATGGFVKKCSEPGKLVEWVKSQGVEMASAAKAEIEELLEFDDLPGNVRHAIMIRQEAAKTSVAKLSSFIDRAAADGRIRGAFLFCAAGTGRWSSVGAQLHNLPRPRKEFGDADPRLDVLFEMIRFESPELLRFLYGEELGKTLWLLSDAIRGFLWADPGKELMVADYSGIEGAVAAWFADEEWKVQAMFDIIDDPKLPDMYRRAAAGIFNTTTELIPKSDGRRQVGKVSELSLQFQGGPGAFRSMARNYSLKLAPLFPIVWEAADEDRRKQAVKRYENACARKEPITQLLNREEFLAAEIVKLGWRATHPAISACWPGLEDAAREAVERPGTVVRFKKVDYLVARGFLWCRLPSGRCLAYGGPKIKEQVWVKTLQEDGSWSDVSETMGVEEAERAEKKGAVAIMRNDEGRYNYAKSAVTALGVNSVTKKWERFALYGGLAFENCLSGNTDVLTPYGWKRITDIQPTDKLWDGLEWVSHSGVVRRSSEMTIDIAGIWMTPDHKVWTDDGWVKAADADIHAVETASPDPEFDRAALREARGTWLRGWRRPQRLVVGPVRLRHEEVVRRFGASQGEASELRLLRERGGIEARDDAWYVQALGLCGMEQYARSLRASFARGLRSVWRAWDNSVRALAQVRELLGGYGAFVAKGVDHRAAGQQRWLFAGQLRLAGSQSSGAEQTQQRDDRHTQGPNAGLRGCGDQRDKRHDHSLPGGRGVADKAHVRSAGLRSADNVEPVYDILNAGPRRRFTVRGSNGPVIVSNCVQAIARDLLANGIKKAEAAGYPVIGHVHDEILAEVPRGYGDVREFEKLICELPAWADGLPLTAGGWRGKRYRKD